jgi:hypothetical protein
MIDAGYISNYAMSRQAKSELEEKTRPTPERRLSCIPDTVIA